MAFGRGGAAETVVDGVTGLLFHEQSSAAIQRVVQEFETVEACFDKAVIGENALRFSTDKFREQFRRFVYNRWHEYKKCRRTPIHLDAGLQRSSQPASPS